MVKTEGENGKENMFAYPDYHVTGFLVSRIPVLRQRWVEETMASGVVNMTKQDIVLGHLSRVDRIEAQKVLAGNQNGR